MDLLARLIDPALLTQPYMQNALLTGTIVAILAALVGVFAVLRGITFSAHALAHVGFAGAAGAVLIGVDPLWGLLVFALGGATSLGLLGTRAGRHDAATALMMGAALGAGALFLALNSAYATAAFSLLFGTIVGVSRAQVWQTGLIGLLCALALAVLYRPLLLVTVNPELAAARGVPLRRLNVLFLGVVGVTAALTVPTVGVLLIFSLLVGPAATAASLARRPGTALLLAVGLALGSTWLGMVLAYATGWPVGFLIAAITALVYLGMRIFRPGARRPDHRYPQW